MRVLGNGVAGGLGAALAVAFGAWPAGAAAATPPALPSVTLHASPAQSVSSHKVVLSGRVSGAPAGSVLRLYKSPYPYPTAVLVRTTVSAADGSFAFTVFPDRSARYRVVLLGTAAHALVQVGVSGRTSTTVKALPLGRTRVTIAVYHPRDLRWNGARVRWSFGTGFRGRLSAGPVTRTMRLSPYVSVLSASVSNTPQRRYTT